MSSTTFVGQPDVMVGGPPPPPPPPPVPNQLPAMRINTVENTAARRPQIVSNDAYEPPAAIQNAMLTKDKKPFTYTPGMGGKLDLSQIRSPRMARRVAKNANDEGIEGPPKVAVESKPPGTSTAANLMVQPQVAIPVLPVNVPAAPLLNRAPSSVNRTSSNTLDKQAETPKIATPKVDIKAVPIAISSSQSSTPESPNTPTQVTLAKAPTPWMQNKNKPQENLPEWAKRPTVNKTANGSSENAHSPTTIYVQVQPSIPQSSQTNLKQEQEWHPTPQDQCQQPLKVQQLPQQRQEPQQKQNIATPHQTNPRYERVVPIRIEDRPSVFDVNRESGHHQFKQPPTVHHQQRWGQIPVQQHTLKNQVQNRSQDQEQSNIHVATVSKPVQSQPSGTTYIIPMVVEGDRKTTPSNTGYNTIEKGIRVVQQQGSAPNTPLIQQNEPGPVQSRSFRVLQKITDTDGSNDVGTEQMRKLDLSEDDRLLMNKFKEQVDHETYLHQEEDPRYRGAAIPSRAFRFLQNMTESNDSPVTCTAPRSSQNIANKRQNRNSKSFEETQTNLPPSEQQVQEPKKYMGSAIPSRSFKILQAMTTPESIATQENRQADYNCQTENNLPGNQQDVFLLSQPVPFWYPESWWYCYSVQQYSDPSAKSANSTNKHSLLPRPYTGYSDGGACVGYESFSPVCNNARYSQADYDGIQQSRTDGNGCDNIYYSVINPPFAQSDGHFVRNDIADESTNTPLEQIDHLDDQSSGTSRSANENCNNDKTCLVTNTVDEEGIVLDSTDNDTVLNNKKMSERTFDLCINVPNYTYMESSDSSDSSDSSQSSSNKVADSCQKVRNCSVTTFSNTSSDSDSDSYVAYSTGLHLYEKLDRNASRATSSDVSDVQNAVAYSGESSTDNCRSDFDSCSDNCELNRRDQECELTTANAVRRHQMNVIDEDTERSDSKGSHCENERNIDERKDALFETTDDPSDDVETMVSVSLPLRFNFSVSENNEDITTVTIGDSKIKAEKSRNSKRRYSDKSSDDNVDNTRVDVTNDTSVKFTVKRYVADAENTASGRETAIPCVDFTLRRDSTKINEGNRERQKNIKTKFASNETEKESERKDFAESVLKEVENRTILKPEIVVREDILPHDEKNHRDRVQHVDSNVENTNRTIRESKANTCEWIQDNFEAPVQVQVIDANETHNETCINAQDNNDDSIINSNDRCVDLEIDQTHTKHLLSVRDSHEDTDDEDSGVTSDISRMISEVDTDSECTSSKTSKKYQRTQTHSRLFRLLNDDTVLSDCSKTDSSFFRLEYPNSPLNVYNDDDDCYCFNYSSDPISPEYSSVRDEQSSRRSYNATVESSNTGSPNIVKLNHPSSSQLKHVPSKDDPHLRAWKSSKLPDLDNVVPSLAYKILDSKMPSWAYKVNVLCPRIKSAKDVPRTLSARSTGNIDNRPSSVILTVPSCAHSKTK